MVIYAFAGLVLLATLILALPFTHTTGGGLRHLFVSTFTATSAITVTGLRLRQLVCKQDQAATFSVIVFMTIPSSYLAPW